MQNQTSAESVLKSRAAVVGLVFGAAYGLLVRFGTALNGTGSGLLVMTVGFLFLVPMSVGYLTVRPVRGATLRFRIFAPWLTCALIVLGAAITSLEGAICIVFAAPVMLIFASIGGVLAGLGRQPPLMVDMPIVLLLPLVSMGIEGYRPLPLRRVVTSTQIEIAAPPSVVWPLVVSVDTIREAERHRALFTTVGFPAPIAATLDRPGVGGVRTASFERGVVFHEVVTTWQPERKLRFTIDAQDVPPTALDAHVTIGGPFFDVLTGTYELHPLSATRTLLVLRSEHRVSTRFNAYAAWWADNIMASIQTNILEILRERAERSAGRG